MLSKARGLGGASEGPGCGWQDTAECPWRTGAAHVTEAEAEAAGDFTSPLVVFQACVEDVVTPIILRLNFSLVGSPLASFRQLRPMLAMDAQRYFTASVSPAVG